MSKDTFYFSHDYNARNDPKLQKLLMKMGQEGKGLYWDLIEMLYEQGGYLQISECDSYAFQLRVQCDCIKNLIDGDFDLFKTDGQKFWSESVLNRLQIRINKSDNARKSANARWRNANAMRTQSDSNAIKERKGKENKGKDIKVNENTNKDIVEKYHALCPKMNKVVVLNDFRKSLINARIKEYTVEKVIEVIKIAGDSSFLNGENDKNWKADFEWIMRPQNFVKIMEGKYNNKPKSNDVKFTF